MPNLNRNSITANFYKWFYVTRQLPLSLCPYFWKLVIASLLFIPYSIISLPFIIGGTLDKRNFNPDKTGERALFGALMYFMLYLLVLIGLGISSFFIKYEHDSFLYDQSQIGILTGIVVVFFGVMFSIFGLVTYLKDKKYNRKRMLMLNDTQKESSIIVEFVKAKYNKYCPKINWYEEK